MHEFGMVDEFIHQLIAKWKTKKPGKDDVIHVSHGPGLLEESLRQAFQVHTAGTSLEGVRFEFRKKVSPVHCSCGALVKIDSEDSAFPYVVCEECQHISPIPEFNVLELLDAC